MNENILNHYEKYFNQCRLTCYAVARSLLKRTNVSLVAFVIIDENRQGL